MCHKSATRYAQFLQVKLIPSAEEERGGEKEEEEKLDRMAVEVVNNYLKAVKEERKRRAGEQELKDKAGVEAEERADKVGGGRMGTKIWTRMISYRCMGIWICRGLATMREMGAWKMMILTRCRYVWRGRVSSRAVCDQS